VNDHKGRSEGGDDDLDDQFNVSADPGQGSAKL
jgi:hypothetical protein